MKKPLVMFLLVFCQGDQNHLEFHVFIDAGTPLYFDNYHRDVKFHLIWIDRPDFSTQILTDNIKKIQKLWGYVDIASFDKEAVRFLKTLRIKKLPALAMKKNGKYHVSYGNKINFTEVLKCTR